MSERPRRYFTPHFLLLRFLGLGWWHHPDEDNTNNFPGLYFFYSFITELIWVAGFVGLETIYPFIGEKDLDRFMFSLSFVITHDLTVIKLYIFLFQNRALQSIVRTLEIDLYQFYQNNDKNRSTVKITRIMSFVFVFFGWLTIGNGSVTGIMQDIRWKAETARWNDSSLRQSRNLPQPIYIPWSYESNISFIFTFALETVGLLWTGHIVMTIDTFVGSLIVHMCNQFVTLQEALETAYDRTMIQLLGNLPRDVQNIGESHNCEQVMQGYYDNNEMLVRKFYTEEQIEVALTNTLKLCVLQHQMLIDCVTKFARTYSYGFMTQLLSSMAAICVVMVQVSNDASSLKSTRLITSLAFFLAMIVQLAMQCFTSNELTQQAGKVSDAVMNSKWELMPPRLRRLLVLMMMRAQKPLQLTAAGFTNMNNGTFLAVDPNFVTSVKIVRDDAENTIDGISRTYRDATGVFAANFTEVINI